MAPMSTIATMRSNRRWIEHSRMATHKSQSCSRRPRAGELRIGWVNVGSEFKVWRPSVGQPAESGDPRRAREPRAERGALGGGLRTPPLSDRRSPAFPLAVYDAVMERYRFHSDRALFYAT